MTTGLATSQPASACGSAACGSFYPFFARRWNRNLYRGCAHCARAIRTGYVGILNLGSFDNITAFHVLEHLHEPLEFVRKCRSLLKPHGRLFFAVPNDLGTPRARLGNSVLRPIQLNGEPEIHLSHFTPDSLSKLLNRCGLRILDLSLDPYWDSGGWKEPLRFALMNPIYRLTRVNLYPTIWIVATA